MKLVPTRTLVAASCLFSSLALADGVNVRSDTSTLAGSIFPSNRYTVFDGTQTTLRRVKLPKPDCVQRPSDCADIDVINTLDGFSTQPRITVPFTGAIDPSTVTSETVYLLNLGDTFTFSGAGSRSMPLNARRDSSSAAARSRRKIPSKALRPTSCCRQNMSLGRSCARYRAPRSL